MLFSLLGTGCGIPLQPVLDSDYHLTLGRFDASDGSTTVYGGVDGNLSVPVTVTVGPNLTSPAEVAVEFALTQDPFLLSEDDNRDLQVTTVPCGAETIVSLALPAGVSEGLYTLYGRLINLPDSAAHDYFSSVAVEIGPDLPDLIVDSVSLSGSGTYGLESQFTATVRILNAGFQAIPGSDRIRVRFSVDVEGSAVILGEADVLLTADLHPGESFSRTVVLVTPAADVLAGSVPPEDFVSWVGDLVVEVDPLNSIIEISEGSTVLRPVILARYTYDLVPESLVLDEHIVSDGATTEALMFISNLGGDDVQDEFSIGLYASSDPVFDATDALLGTQIVTSAVPAGAQTIIRMPVTIPDDLDFSGFVYVFGAVDIDGDIGEIDEDNNTPVAHEPGGPTPTDVLLIYDDENPARAYDLRFVTYPPYAGYSHDITMYLFDGNGVQLAYNDDGGEGAYSMIDRTVTPGTYYVRIAPYSAGRSGTYTFAVIGPGMNYVYGNHTLSGPASDLYEPDDDSTDDVPIMPADYQIADPVDRYVGGDDRDWIRIELP
jgi:hypothetical protein